MWEHGQASVFFIHYTGRTTALSGGCLEDHVGGGGESPLLGTLEGSLHLPGGVFLTVRTEAGVAPGDCPDSGRGHQEKFSSLLPALVPDGAPRNPRGAGIYSAAGGEFVRIQNNW